MNSWVSSAVPPGGAGPSAAALEVNTTRSTSARRHSPSTVLVPPTLTSNIRSASPSRIEVTPAAWKTRSTPFSARRTARRSVTSQRTRSQSTPSSTSTGERSRTVTRRSSPRSHQRAGEMRADEPGRSGQECLGQLR